MKGGDANVPGGVLDWDLFDANDAMRRKNLRIPIVLLSKLAAASHINRAHGRRRAERTGRFSITCRRCRDIFRPSRDEAVSAELGAGKFREIVRAVSRDGATRVELQARTDGHTVVMSAACRLYPGRMRVPCFAHACPFRNPFWSEAL